MIYCYTPFDKDFPYEDCKKMYEENKTLLEDNNTFNGVLKNTLFFAFMDKQKLIGCIYYYMLQDGLWYVNAFAGRKTHLTNLTCLKWSLNCFKEVYAKTKHKTALLCLKKLGFKHVENDLYKYIKE